MDIEQYISRFAEEPGYLDFARLGPVGTTVQEEVAVHLDLLSRARFGSLDLLAGHDERMREAVAGQLGVAADQVVFQPDPGLSLDRLVAMLPGVLDLRGTGQVSAGTLREQLDAGTATVALSLVDERRGHLADLEGIRQVIGDRLLVVDAAQGFGVVEAPYGLADVVGSTGTTWVRAGWGTGFLAFSARAAERLPVRLPTLLDPDPLAQIRLAMALEELAEVGVPLVAARIEDRVSRIVALADEYAVPVVSPRASAERAGIVALEPEPAQLVVLAAALHNHGITATVQDGQLRLSAHATTDDETLAMLGAAFLAYSTAVPA